MKKIFFVALLATAGLASANDLKMKKNSQPKKEFRKKAKKTKAERCYQYAMMAWCRPNETVIDTVCYDTSVQGSYEHSQVCQRENCQLYNIFMCKTTDYIGSTTTFY